MRFIFLLFVFFACERKFEFIKFECEDCFQEKPEYGPIIIFFSIEEENDFILYTIFKGNFEDGIIEYADTAFFNEEQIDVPVNQYYSVEAKYIQNTDTIRVIDGDMFKLKKETEQCDKDCFYYKGGIIDVRLRKQ